MSRHRNIRNIDYDDYYDDYDDDYDDDDYYDDYDESYVAKKQPTASTQKQSNNKAKTQQSKQQKPPSNNNNTTSKKSGSTTATLNNKTKVDTKVSGGTLSIGKGITSISSSKPKIIAIKGNNKKVAQDVLTSPAPSSNETTTIIIDDGLLQTLKKQQKEKQRSKLSMVVLGHVDAGKSTLIGQVLLQLGTIDKRLINKYQKEASQINKESFALAWVMDEESEERERGVTMDIGTKYISIENHDICILDAPGHADFIPNMISGTASADVGLLVIASTIGEFEAGFSPPTLTSHGGQTREHIILSRGLGVSQLIVAINKLDVISWDEHRFNEIKNKIHAYLLQNGFNTKRIRYVPVSGLTGINVKCNIDVKGLEWYNGPTLLEAMNSYIPAQRNFEKPLRVLISDTYQEGRYVTTRGKVIQGLIRTNDKVSISPIMDEATVYRIEHQNTSSALQKYAIAGDTVNIILNSIDIMRINIGCILCHTLNKVPLKKKFIAQIVVMENLSIPIICGAQVLLHMHSIDVPATISKLLSLINKKNNNSNKSTTSRPPRVLTAGVNATVEIRTIENLCLEEYKECRSLGRFVLRRNGDTIAVGVIEKLL